MGTAPLPPDAQLVLQQLFRLFSQYTSSADEAERENLKSQILNLFSQLGVAGEHPLVTTAQRLFRDISRRPEAKTSLEVLPVRARTFVTDEIRRLQRRTGIRLTSGGREMLRIPVTEAVERTETFDAEQAGASLARVFSTLSEQPESPSEGGGRTRTSIAVVRAYWKNFCNIPPICKGTDGKQ